MNDKVNTYDRLKKLIEQIEMTDRDFSMDDLDRRLIGMALRSIKAVIDSKENYGPFICGVVGQPDVMGLYDKFMVCPQYGLSGFAVYKKDRDYSEPEY